MSEETTKCSECGGAPVDLCWYHLSFCKDETRPFCSRRCLVEFIAPELKQVAVVKQWIPTEEETKRMSEEST